MGLKEGFLHPIDPLLFSELIQDHKQVRKKLSTKFKRIFGVASCSSPDGAFCCRQRDQHHISLWQEADLDISETFICPCPLSRPGCFTQPRRFLAAQDLPTFQGMLGPGGGISGRNIVDDILSPLTFPDPVAVNIHLVDAGLH